VGDHDVEAATPDLGTDELDRWLVETPTPLGKLTRLRPLVRFSDGTLQDLPPWHTYLVSQPKWI
jgi:hypothetical protein